MRELGHRGFKVILSLVRRLFKRIAHDITADLHDIGQWSSQNIPPAVGFVTEKWLGLWYAFVGTTLVGLLGMTLVEIARWSSHQPVLAKTVPRLILMVGGTGFFVVLLWGIVFSALLVVSVVRILLWIRNIWVAYWDKNTPPYRDSASVTRSWPPSEKAKDQAQKKSWEYFKKGAFWFPVITVVLLVIESNFSDQIYPVVSDFNWSSMTDVVSATFSIIDIEGLIRTVGISLGPLQVIGFICIFVLPGLLVAISVRNLLFLTEAHIRESMNKAANGSRLEWRRIWLVVQVITSSLYATVVLYAMIYGA